MAQTLRMRRVDRAVLGTALLVVVGTPTFVFGVHMPRFVTLEGGIERAHCARSALPAPPPPGHLTVVMVDGLGHDHARTSVDLEWLRHVGAIRALEVSFPSYTTPAVLSFVTGLDPRASGVRLNASTHDATVGLDHLGRAAEDVGRPIEFFDGGWQPFGEIVFADDSQLRSGRRTMETAPFLPRSERSIRFVYFGDVDEAGHEHGEASDAYRAGVARAATLLRRFHATLGPDDRLLMVSDHGHLASGGHGGVEAEVLRATAALVGRDAKSGEELAARPIVDVASTIAVLGGLPVPGCNLGRPMLDMLALDEATAASMLAPAHEQRALLAAIAPGLAQAQPSPEPSRSWRLSALGLSVLGAALGVGRRPRRPRSWLALALLALGYVSVLASRGYRLTFSKMPPQDDFIRDATLAALVGLMIALGYAWRRPTEHQAAVLLAGVLTPWLAMVAWEGIDPRVVPTPYVSLAIILWAPLLLAAALGAVVLTLRGRSAPTAARPEPPRR